MIISISNVVNVETNTFDTEGPVSVVEIELGKVKPRDEVLQLLEPEVEVETVEVRPLVVEAEEVLSPEEDDEALWRAANATETVSVVRWL